MTTRYQIMDYPWPPFDFQLTQKSNAAFDRPHRGRTKADWLTAHVLSHASTQARAGEPVKLPLLWLRFAD